MNNQQLLIPMSQCLSLWANSSSIEIKDKRYPKNKSNKIKIGRDDSGNLLSVDFRYLKNKEIEIYSARRIV